MMLMMTMMTNVFAAILLNMGGISSPSPDAILEKILRPFPGVVTLLWKSKP